MATDLPTSPGLHRRVDAVRENAGWFTALGILWMVLGVIAIIVPFAATLAAELFLGALFVVGGVAQLVQGFRARGWGGFAAHLLGGVLALAAGLLLLFFPLQGILTLTLVLAAFFLVEGVLKLVAAFGNRHLDSWIWLLASGIVGIIVGMLIWSGWPGTAAWALGVLVGIELIFSGWALIMLARPS